MTESHQTSNARVAKNTVFLYFRTLLIIGIGLYISRAILQALGVEDFGIYNVVGGIVLMFSFINSGMVASTQRFISYELGRNDAIRLRQVFSMAVSVHLLLALIILVLAETIGLWFLNTHMNIAPERLYAANWVYQCSIFAFIVIVLTVPYSASIVAHEHMKAFAYGSVLDYVLRLLAVLLLPFVPHDKLIVYSISILLVTVITRLGYVIYCRYHFSECSYLFSRDKSLFMEMFSFAGWSFIGNLGFSVKDQGINILINLFFGAAVNAARGIAYQVSTVVSSFMANFQMAINPQITKRYASGETDSMLRLVFASAKYSFFLLMIIVIPFWIRAPYVLELWLGNVPDYTVAFLRLVLIMLLVDSMANPLLEAMQATGKIRNFQLVVAIIMLSNLPLSYCILKLGADAYSVMYVAIATSVAGLVARLLLLRASIPFDIWGFIKNILVRNFVVLILGFLAPFWVSSHFYDNFAGMIGVIFVSLISSLVIIYIIGLQPSERAFLVNKIVRYSKKNIR